MKPPGSLTRSAPRPLRVGSFCSGIAAPEVAWRSLGWQPQFFSEIDPFASAVLAHHFPGVPNLGDMEAIHGEQFRSAVDVVCAGTPCQSFSVAGLRGGMADPRGNLALVFLRLVDQIRPRWVVWENVPGVLSSGDGRDFGSFLGALGQLGYGWAYRVLDAQHFGVPQRRRRVFVVGHIGDWRLAAAVLFERHCLSGHPAPGREAGARVADGAARGAISIGRGWWDESDVGATIRAQDSVTKADTLIAHSLRAEGFDASEDGTGRGTPIVPVAFDWQSGGSHPTRPPTMNMVPDGTNALGSTRTPAVVYPLQEVGKRESKQQNGVGIGIGSPSEPMYTLQAGAQHGVAHVQVRGVRDENDGPAGPRGDSEVAGVADSVPELHPLAFQTRIARNGRGQPEQVCPTLQGAGAGATSDMRPCVKTGMAVRRLTPRECERLMGFEDDYTLIPYRGKPASDGPRYRAIGNSMCVNVLRWLGERIEQVEAVIDTETRGGRHAV